MGAYTHIRGLSLIRNTMQCHVGVAKTLEVSESKTPFEGGFVDVYCAAHAHAGA